MADSRIALVTGAGTGIGAASALALARDGWTVVCVGRRVEPLQKLVADHPDLALDPRPADVTDENEVATLFAGVARAASAGSTCCSTTPAPARRPVALDELTSEQIGKRWST